MHQIAQLDYEKHKDCDRISFCTDKERWYDGHKYAVKRQAIGSGIVNKNATRVFKNKADAIQFMQENVYTLPKGKQWAPLEERQGLNRRCQYYCDVWEFCPFGRLVRGKVDIEQEELEDAIN